MIYNEHIIYDIFVTCWKQVKYHTIDCPPVCVDNPRVLASGLSYIQTDKHGITILNYIISVDFAHHEIVLTKVGKDSINAVKQQHTPNLKLPFKTIEACCIFILNMHRFMLN